MSDPVGPVSRSPRHRRVGARAFLPVLRAAAAEDVERASRPQPTHDRVDPAPPPGEPAAFAAQVIGGGPKRGLRGGPETLETARNVYLETEWSGGADRRHQRGKIAKREI